MLKRFSRIAAYGTALCLLAVPAGAATLRYGGTTPPLTMDPHATNDFVTASLVRQVYDSLVGLADDMSIEPGIATEWTYQGSNTWRFKLRTGIKFHDGRVLSSADVKYTLDLVFSSDFAKSASFYEGEGANKRSLIQSVEAPDARTIIVKLTKPWVGLLSNLVPVPIIMYLIGESMASIVVGCLLLVVWGFFAILVGLATALWTMKAIVVAMTRNLPARESLHEARRLIRLEPGAHFAVAFIMLVIWFGGTALIGMFSGFASIGHATPLAIFTAPLHLALSLLNAIFSAGVESWFLASFISMES